MEEMMNVINLMTKKKTVCPFIIFGSAMWLACMPSPLYAQFGSGTPTANASYFRNSGATQQAYQQQQQAHQQLQQAQHRSAGQAHGFQRPQTQPSSQRTAPHASYLLTGNEVQQAAYQESPTSPTKYVRQNDPTQLYMTQQNSHQGQFSNDQNLAGPYAFNSHPTSYRSNLPSRATGMFERSQMLRASRDSRAKQLGDLLTVDVKIQTVVNNQDQRQLRKSTGSDGNANAEATGVESFDINYGSSSDRSLTGQTSLRETRTMTDSFQTKVVDVRNDILFIQGERYVTVQGDLRKLILSGQINRNDVSIGNRISSDFVYGMRLEYEGVGPEQEYIRQGWLKRQISKVWPF